MVLTVGQPVQASSKYGNHMSSRFALGERALSSSGTSSVHKEFRLAFMAQGGWKKCLPFLAAVPFPRGPVPLGTFRTVCPFAGLAVNLLFQSTDLQRSCRDRWFLASMDHGSEHGSGYFSVFEGGQVWLLYVSVITPFNAFFHEKRNLF